MKIAMLGSLGQINRESIPRLIAKGHELTLVTPTKGRVSQIEALGARAALGVMADQKFLASVFKGQDAVYLMVAAAADNGLDLNASMKSLGEGFVSAVLASGVKNVVLLSSVGAENENAGALYAYHELEAALGLVAGLNLAIIRPVHFYSNLFEELSALDASHQIYSPISADVKRGYVAPSDIAAVQEALLEATPKGKTVRYVVSDWATGNDWVAALQKEGIEASYQKITDSQYRFGLQAQGLTEEAAELFVQMNRAEENSEIFYRSLETSEVIQGTVKLADFAAQFAKIYKEN